MSALHNSHVLAFQYEVALTKHDAHVLDMRSAVHDSKCCSHVVDWHAAMRAAERTERDAAYAKRKAARYGYAS